MRISPGHFVVAGCASYAMANVTAILQAAQSDQRFETSELFAVVYDELQRLARWHMAQEKVDHTLDATALVHEAYMRLVGGGQNDYGSRSHFFAAASEAMRRIIVDAARRRLTRKRGGDRDRVAFDEDHVCVQRPEELLAVHEALDGLASHDAETAQVIELHYFAGFSLDQVATIVGVSRATANRRWTYGKAWLRRAIES